MADRQDRRRAQRVKLEWTARLETGAGVVEGPVVDLSIIGVRIGTPANLPVGTPGTLTLTFSTPDDRQEMVSLTATVARCGEDCVAATFGGLPEPAGRWLRVRLLSGDSRRRSPRVHVALPVELSGGSMAPIQGETLDVSAFGARVTTFVPLSPGARLECTLSLDDRKPPLVTPTVVWDVAGSEAVLVFANLRSRDFDRLGDYVLSRLPPERA